MLVTEKVNKFTLNQFQLRQSRVIENYVDSIMTLQIGRVSLFRQTYFHDVVLVFKICTQIISVAGKFMFHS